MAVPPAPRADVELLAGVRADHTTAAGSGPDPGRPSAARSRRLAVRPAERRRSRTGALARPAHLRLVREAGMASAEYAVALIAACAFAAVLLAAIKAGAVLTAIGKLITAALKVIT